MGNDRTSLTCASTVAIIVHGVGDHSSGRILQKALEGLKVFAGSDVKAQEVKIPGLPELENDAEAAAGLEIKTGEQTHFIVPIVWSRLRPRAANEADLGQAYPGAASRVFDRLFQPIVYLFPACINAIRCIPAAPGVIRRFLVGVIALAYAIFVPGFLMCGFVFVSYLVTLRLSLDKIHFIWWRILILLAICWLLDWLVGKILMVFDFVGDVVAYVGSTKHRRKAEERLLRVIQAIAKAGPDAQILVVGHSLGSVLVTQSVLQLNETANLGHRLSIVTMGSPLRLMSWFFPSRIHSPEQLIGEFERRNINFSWANMWRDADIIGRALKVTSGKRFAESSLGNGTHADYWADARCWQAVVNYLRAMTDQTLETLIMGWNAPELSLDEEREFYLVRKARTALIFLVWGSLLIGIVCVDYFWHVHERIETLTLAKRVLVYLLGGMIGILMVLWYVFTTQPVGVTSSTGREMLMRYRLNWFIGTTCLKLAFAIGAGAGLTFILWKSFTA